jgi:hypothetical protein
MTVPPGWFDSARWEWFAAGDLDAKSRTTREPSEANSEQRVLFEIGLFLLVPLALAALIEIIFGA